MQKFTTKTLTLMALLIALEIVLSRFLSVSAWNMKIGFSFVPQVLAALLLGPLYAGIVGALADLLGAVLFPVGPYFPGFTLTAFLAGVLYGLLLFRQSGFPRILAAAGLRQFLLSLLLNTFWISVLYDSPFRPLLLTRLPQCALLFAVELAVIPLLVKLAPRLKGAGNG